MAPKRKRAEPAAPAPPKVTRSTRKRKELSDDEMSVASSTAAGTAPAPAAKKTRKTTARNTRGQSVAGQISELTIEDQSTHIPKSNGEASTAVQSVVTQGNHPTPATKPKLAKAASTKTAEPEPYTAARAISLFSTYADADEPSVIGAEGFERLCEDAELPLEGVEPLLLAWQLGTSEMARITKEEWDKGTAELQISSLPTLSLALRDLEAVIFPARGPRKPSTHATAPPKKKATGGTYNRARLYNYINDPTKSFNELYMFCFNLAKPPGARNIDMQIALAFWSVLVLPRYPIMQDILDFINEKGTYKGVNKDLWLMILEFCRSISPTLQDYEADGAWPTMLDDFVSWKKSKTTDAAHGQNGNGSTNHD